MMALLMSVRGQLARPIACKPGHRAASFDQSGRWSLAPFRKDNDMLDT
jgi:hypothetical protein